MPMLNLKKDTLRTFPDIASVAPSFSFKAVLFDGSEYYIHEAYNGSKTYFKGIKTNLTEGESLTEIYVKASLIHFVVKL